MKEAKFIELLNLYIDQQISPEEAARLENEIIANARRRRTYQQYCRMHRACTLVFENFSTQPDHATEPGRRSEELYPFARHRRFRRWWQYSAAAAAVACLSFAGTRLYLHSRTTVALTPATSPAAMDATPVHFASTAPAALPVGQYATQRLYLGSPLDRARVASLVFTSAPSRPISPAVAETISTGTRPTIEQFVFRTNSPLASGGSVVLRTSSPADGQEEMAAYQFQR